MGAKALTPFGSNGSAQQLPSRICSLTHGVKWRFPTATMALAWGHRSVYGCSMAQLRTVYVGRAWVLVGGVHTAAARRRTK